MRTAPIKNIIIVIIKLFMSVKEHIKSTYYPNINFTMVYDYMEIKVLVDLFVYVQNGFLTTKIFSKPTNKPRVSRCMVVAPTGSV